MAPIKQKLRTAAEVISRLKWAPDETTCSKNIVIGYDCRINGPMEKRVADFTGIQDGGDIPEHRIQYFRRAELPLLILWDRQGRVDRLFGSGNGATAKVPPSTMSNIHQAMETMTRLAEEKAIRAEERAKRRARQQAKKKAAQLRKQNATTAAQNATCQWGESKPSFFERHTWADLKSYYAYDEASRAWARKETQATEATRNLEERKTLKLLTWNVLFDLHRDDRRELVHGDDSLLDDSETTEGRWSHLIDTVVQQQADIVTLQEVTPRFLQQLQNHRDVTGNYDMSASHFARGTVEPYGNLTLWRRSLSPPNSIHLCTDGGRNRAVVVSLRHGSGSVLNVANVHLPADQHDHSKGRTIDRTQARQREVSGVIGKLQLMEQTHQCGLAVPLILGDFNSGDQDISGLLPKGYFADAWLLSDVGNSPGFTFDWKLNARAEKTRTHGHSEKPPRRNDRICVGKSLWDHQNESMAPVQAELLGNDMGCVPPSDHFGVSATLQLPRITSLEQNPLYELSCVNHNAWSASAIPTTESLLALVFEENELDKTPLFDASSSLPAAHVTLLNGFVDLSTHETQALATQTVEDAIRQTLCGSSLTKSWPILFNAESLTVFEHRDSASLVLTPNLSNPAASWLGNLYETLRLKFARCNEQECRFVDGWTPHVSLGSFPTTDTAREELDQLHPWFEQKERRCLEAFGVGLFRRDATDGKFYVVDTVSLCPKRRSKVEQTDMAQFLSDAGRSWFSSMRGASTVVLKEVERACQNVAQDMWAGDIQASMHGYGSHALGTSIPVISDVDLVVKLQPSFAAGNHSIQAVGASEFFRNVAERLKALHPHARIRTRVSSLSGSTALYMMTIKLLGRHFPSIDLLLCRMDSSGVPIDSCSQAAWSSVEDSMAVLRMVESLPTMSRVVDMVAVFQGALRIIKLWADRRQVYGQRHGYLGGSGWAVLLAWVMGQSDVNAILNPLTKVTTASLELAIHFFKSVTTLWSKEFVVRIDNAMLDKAYAQQTCDVALSRNTMCVLAPVSGGNFGRAATKSSSLTTWKELSRMKERLQQEPNLKHHFEPPASPSYLLVKAEIPKAGELKPAEIKAWAAASVLTLVVELEKTTDPDCIRPFSKVEKKGGMFWFRIGLTGEVGPRLFDFIKTQKARLAQEKQQGILRVTLHIEIVNPNVD